MADDLGRQLADLLYGSEPTPESPQDQRRIAQLIDRERLRRLTGAAEVAGTLGSGLLSAIPAGYAALGTLMPTRAGSQGDLRQAAQRVQDVQGALTYLPRTETGQQYLEKTVGALEPLSVPAKYAGDIAQKYTGSPVVGGVAETLADPINLVGTGIPTKMAKAGVQAAKAAPRVAGEMLQDLVIGSERPGSMRAQRGAVNLKSKTPYERSLEQGYEHGWLHGTTGDIRSFDPSRMGEATGAASAKKGFFFVRDPIAPPEEMLKKTSDPKSIELVKGHLQKLGVPDEEIEALNQVSFKGNAAETASGYSSIGGSRTYKEAMRKANEAEKRGDWAEHDRQMQIAEDSEMDRLSEAQGLVAKYGDRRDEMTDAIQKAVYDRVLPQKEAEELDKWYKSYMPYGWYNSYSPAQFKGLKKELISKIGEERAAPAIEAMNEFEKVRAERNLAEKSQEGANVMPVALRYKNPFVYDFKGSSYRDQSYSDLIDQAILGGHDALILRNTYDPGGGPAKLVDIGVVFDPSQIRSTFAKFNPKDIKSADITKKDGGPVHISDNPDTMALELAIGGAVKGAKAAKEAAKAAEKAVPPKLPRAEPKTKAEIEAIAERIAPQVLGKYVRKSEESAVTAAGKTKKQFEREKELPVVLTGEAKTPSALDLTSLQGKALIGILGDPSITGRSLESVGDIRLGLPSPQHGGPLYGLGHEGEAFWASGKGAAKKVQNLADEVSKQYGTDVLGKYIMMGPEGLNYAQHFADANLQAIDLSKMTKRQIEEFNDLIRKGSPASGPRPSFPGIEDKGSAYLHFAMDPKLRIHFNALMQKPTVTEAFNLPSGQDIRFAITEPALRDLERGVTGMSIGEMRPGAELTRSAHPTYEMDIPGRFLGSSKYPIPYELMFPDTVKAIRSNPKQAPHEFGSLGMVGPRQIIDQQLIDELKVFDEQMKKLTGKKKGGAVRKADGGEVTIPNMSDGGKIIDGGPFNKGGAVKMQVGGALKAAAKAAEKAAAQTASKQAAEQTVKSIYPQADALERARQNAVKMLGLPENNTAMDRARAMGFDDNWFHGTNRDFPAFENSMLGAKTGAKSAQKAHFLAKNPELSNTYVNTENVFPLGYKAAPPVYESLFKNKDAFAEFNAAPDWESQWRVLEKYGMNYGSGQVMPLMVRLGNQRVKDYGGAGYRDVTYNDELKAAKKGKKDSVVFKNTFDPGPHEGRNVQTDVAAIFDPSRIRSRFAAFDPAEMDKSDLLKKKGGKVSITDNLDTMRLAVQKRK